MSAPRFVPFLIIVLNMNPKPESICESSLHTSIDNAVMRRLTANASTPLSPLPYLGVFRLFKYGSLAQNHGAATSQLAQFPLADAQLSTHPPRHVRMSGLVGGWVLGAPSALNSPDSSQDSRLTACAAVCGGEKDARDKHTN